MRRLLATGGMLTALLTAVSLLIADGEALGAIRAGIAPLLTTSGDRSLRVLLKPVRHAGCVNAASVSGSTFDYELCDLPDLDQHRKPDLAKGVLGLPDNGASWCAPTSVMNAFAYFAGHGLPTLPPGNHDWTSPANYNAMTSDLVEFGSDMGTNPKKGTNGAGISRGITAWLRAAPLVDIELTESPGALHTAPTLAQMAAAGAAGGVVIPDLVFIKHDVPGSELWYVHGGHVVTMSAAESPSTIGLHDPATPTTRLTYQAPYTEQKYTVTPIKLTYVRKSGASITGTFLRIDNYRLDKRFNNKHYTVIIASFSIIEPETITSWGPPGSRTTFVHPFRKRRTSSFDTSGGQVIDLALDPIDSEDFYTTSGTSTIWALNTANGTSTPFAQANGQPGPVAFADGSRTLFVSGTGGLTAFDALGRSIASAAILQPIDAIAVQQAKSNVLALSTESGRLRIFDSLLNLLGTVTLPQPTLAGTGTISIAVHDHVLYIHRNGEPMVAVVALPAKPTTPSTPLGYRFVRLPGAIGSNGLAVDDAGRIFVQNKDGRLAEYGPAGTRLTRSPFNGTPIGPGLTVTARYASPGLDSIPIDTPIP